MSETMDITPVDSQWRQFLVGIEDIDRPPMPTHTAVFTLDGIEYTVALGESAPLELVSLINSANKEAIRQYLQTAEIIRVRSL